MGFTMTNKVYNNKQGSSSGTNLIACTSLRRENQSEINTVLYSSRGKYSRMGSRYEMLVAIKDVKVNTLGGYQDVFNGCDLSLRPSFLWMQGVE